MYTNNLSLNWFDFFVFLVVVLSFINQKHKLFLTECIKLLFVITANCVSIHYVFRMAEVFKKFEYALVPYKLQPIFIFILINVVLISMGIFFKKATTNCIINSFAYLLSHDYTT